MMLEILHKFGSVAGKLMKNRILGAVKLQRFHLAAFTQLLIEGRGSLHPFVLQVKLRIAVHHKNVTAKMVDEFLVRKVIGHIRQTDAAWDPDAARHSTIQHSFGDAIGAFILKDVAGGYMVRAWLKAVGIIADQISHS